MPYIGHGVTNAGTFYVLDDLTMSSSTTYTLQVGGVSVTPKADNLLITLDGVVQHTPDAYTISGSTLTFASAPGSGVDFYGIIMGQSASIGQGSIGADELKVTGDGSANQVLSSDADGTMTWKDGTLSTTSATGDIIYRNASGVLAKLSIGSAGQLLTVASGLPSWATDSEPYLPLAGGTMSGAINLGSQNVTNGGTITGTFVGGLTGNVTGNASGTALTVTQAAQTSITRVGSSLGVGLAPTHNFNLSAAGLVEARFASTDNDCQLQISSDTDRGQSSILNFLSGSSGRGSIEYDHNATSASEKMIFKTGNNAVTSMVIDGAGNVGIGTAAPFYDLEVAMDTDKHLGITDSQSETGDCPTIVAANTAHSALVDLGFRGDNIIFATGSSERLRIDSSGNVGIGTASPNTIAGNTWTDIDTQIRGTSGGAALAVVGATQAMLFLSDEDATANSKVYGIASIGGDFRIDAWNDNEGLKGTRLAIDSSGNVGIGTASPGYPLDIKASGNNEDLFRLSHPSAPTDAGFMIGFNTDGTTDNNVISLGVEYSNTDYDVINIQRSTRNVGIGTTAPASSLSVHTTTGMDINSATGGGAPRFWLYNYETGNESANIQFHKSKSGTIGNHGVVADGTDIGRIAFYASDGDSWESSAEIRAEIDGTPGGGDVPGRLTFSTTSDGSSATTQRVRIDRTGNLLIFSGGSTSGSNNSRVSVGIESIKASSSSNYVYVDTEGMLFQGGSTSDERMKKDFEPLTGSLVKINNLSPISFKWKYSDEEDIGFTAQNVQSEIPLAVVEDTIERTVDDETFKPLLLEYMKLIPYMAGAIQELSAKVTALENA